MASNAVALRAILVVDLIQMIVVVGCSVVTVTMAVVDCEHVLARAVESGDLIRSLALVGINCCEFDFFFFGQLSG